MILFFALQSVLIVEAVYDIMIPSVDVGMMVEPGSEKPPGFCVMEVATWRLQSR